MVLRDASRKDGALQEVFERQPGTSISANWPTEEHPMVQIHRVVVCGGVGAQF